MSERRTQIAAGIAVMVSLGLLYWRPAAKLGYDWINDGNYSHGFFIIPLALYFAWERRARLRTAVRPSNWGLAIVAFGLFILLAGLLGADIFLPRVSFVIVLAGSVVFLGGWTAFRVLAFPLAFLFLMVPIPAIIFNRIAFPLQLFASQVGEFTLSSLGIPVLREGNVMVLANTTLEVAEACSGIRSLISLLTLGIVYGYFTDPRVSVRTVIALATIPIAILANGARVAGTGVAAHYFGEQAAQGFFHEFSGWMVFVAAFAMLFAVTALVLRLLPKPRPITLPASTVVA